MLFVELAARENEVTNSLSFEIERRRRFAPTPVRAPYPDPLEELGFGRYLAGNARVPVDGHFGEQARALIASDALPLEKTRAVFDHILQTYSYDSSGCTPEKGDSLGNLEVACDLKLGTCTELHGLLIAYLRALGVPARFAFGFNVPARAQGTIGGCHCWAEAFLPGSGWFPLDVSEARKRPAGADREFFFGNLDENRVQFSTGRDLVLVPPQSASPVDKFIFPHAEVDGIPTSTRLEFAFASGEPEER